MTAAAIESGTGQWSLSPRVARAVFVVALAVAMAAAFVATDAGASEAAVAAAGADLTRLLRAMAALKAVMAGGLALAVWWRLGFAISMLRLGATIGAVASAAAGPVLIWDMAHVVSGAALLHAGLLAGIILLWRDPAVARRLADVVKARRLKQAVLF